MSDGRPPAAPASPGDADDSEWLASQFDETGQHRPVTGATAETDVENTSGDIDVEPAAGETGPLVPRQLPSAASFFGEPRAPRHSAHAEPPSSAPDADVAPPASPVAASRDAGLPTEQPSNEQPSNEQPSDEQPLRETPPIDSTAPPAEAAVMTEASSEPQPPSSEVAPAVPSASHEPVSPATPHPMALDLSTLQGGEDLVRDPVPAPPSTVAPEASRPDAWHLGDEPASVDASALPAHDGEGETPTAAFGAVFGAAPADAGAPSFTELISIDSDAPAPTSEPATFDWSDVGDPHTTEVVLPQAVVASADTPLRGDSPAPAVSPDPEQERPATPDDFGPPTEAMPVVWSLSNDDDGAKDGTHGESAAGGTEQPEYQAESGQDSGLAMPPEIESPSLDQNAPTDPPTDPLVAIFGIEGDQGIQTGLAEPRAGSEEPIEAAGDENAVDEERSWADEPRDPIPPALEPPPSAASVAPVDVPTVAYEPPAPTAPYRGVSARPVTPIDASNAPASWAAAAPGYRSAVDGSALPQSEQTPSGVRPKSDDGSGGGMTPGQRRILLFAGIGVAFVIILVALFFAGQALVSNGATPAPAVVSSKSSSTAVSASASATPTPSASRTAAPAPTTASGPAAPGTRSWTDLQGGECLGSFSNAWQGSYQVVDCSSGHPAQMLTKGTVSGTTYPGLTALAAQVGPLCQANTVIDFSKATAYTDIQLSSSYPATQAQWDAGNRSYYCFVSRSSGQAIAGSLKAGQ